MERMEIKKRVRGLFVWILVGVLLLQNPQAGLVSVYAEGTDTTVNIPVNYYQAVYSEDQMENHIPIKDRNSAGDGDAYFVSDMYTVAVTAEKNATFFQDITAPVVEKDGYFFLYWGLGISGGYDETTREITLGDGYTAALLAEQGGLPMVAYFQEKLKSVIKYDYTGGVMDGIADTFSYEIAQPDMDTYVFQEPVTESVPTMSGSIFTNWSMEETDTNWYDEEIGIINGYFGQGETSTLYANWRDEGIITIDYLISNDDLICGELGSDIVPVTFYESQTAEPAITLPTPTSFPGYVFVCWRCLDENTQEVVADLPGYDATLGGYPAGTVFEPQYQIDESSGNLEQGYNMYAVFQPAEELQVFYDVNGGSGLTEQIIYQNNISETEAIFTLPPVSAPANYRLKGWLCTLDGKMYEEGEEVCIAFEEENVNFIAQWREENTVSLNMSIAKGFENAGTINTGMAGTYGENYNIGNGNMGIFMPEIASITEGYLFAGWKCYDADGEEVIADGYTEITDYDGSVISYYPVGAKLSLAFPTDENNEGGKNATYTLEAQFKKAAMIKINFDLNGGTGAGIANDTLYQTLIGESVVWTTMPEEPTKEKSEFLGWYFNGAIFGAGEDAGVQLAEEEITFIARWKQLVEAGKLLLQVDEVYKLPEGNWTVDGDTTVYVGGTNFYVSEETEYTFIQK